MDLYTKSGEAGASRRGTAFPLQPHQKGRICHMRTRDNLISVHLTEDESDRLKDYADMCGLTQSALLRMAIRGRRPQPLPPESFWKMLNELYITHGYLPHIEQREIEAFILQIQAAVTLSERI